MTNKKRQKLTPVQSQLLDIAQDVLSDDPAVRSWTALQRTVEQTTIHGHVATWCWFLPDGLLEQWPDMPIEGKVMAFLVCVSFRY